MVTRGQNPKHAYEDAIRRLATTHGPLLEDPNARIFAFPDPDLQQVRLLEVTVNTFASGEVFVVPIAPSGSFPFPTRIAQVTPEEYERISRGELPLPVGWTWTSKKQVWPSNPHSS